jgi:hypothetical protein
MSGVVSILRYETPVAVMVPVYGYEAARKALGREEGKP